MVIWSPRDGGGPRSCLFTPDGKGVGAFVGDEFILWDAASGKELKSLPVRIRGTRYPSAFSPDGRHWAHPGLPAKVWDVATGKELFPLQVPKEVIPPGTEQAAENVAFSADGRHLAVWYPTVLVEGKVVWWRVVE